MVRFVRGTPMKIAIDKNSLDAIKPGYEYIYLFDNEPLEDLLKTGLHCIRYDKCDFVDINLTDYKVNCLKQATLQDNNYDKLPERKDFKIGIIVPNCNYADCLEKCLGSILKQTYKNFEIIFVDDMSTDNSLELLTEFSSKKEIWFSSTGVEELSSSIRPLA